MLRMNRSFTLHSLHMISHCCDFIFKSNGIVNTVLMSHLLQPGNNTWLILSPIVRERGCAKSCIFYVITVNTSFFKKFHFGWIQVQFPVDAVSQSSDIERTCNQHEHPQESVMKRWVSQRRLTVQTIICKRLILSGYTPP